MAMIGLVARKLTSFATMAWGEVDTTTAHADAIWEVVL